MQSNKFHANMAFKPPKPLQIISWNANGMSNKWHELEPFLQELNADVLCIQESRLNKRQPPKIPNYLSIHKPQGLGLVTYYKKHLQPTQVQTNTTDSETLAIKINSVTIVNYYNNHQSPLNIEELENLTNLDTKVVIAGDFNARHSHWNCLSSNANGTLLLNYLQSSTSTLHYPQNAHTYYPPRDNALPSTIDLIVNKNCTVSQPIALNNTDSDHYPVIFKISGITTPTPNSAQFKRFTDWSLFSSKVYNKIHLNTNIITKSDVDREIRILTKTIQSC